MHIPSSKERAHRRRPTSRSTRWSSSTRTASSPTASATTRSSTSGRTSPSRSPTRCSTRAGGREREQGGEFNPIYMMADSGARGSQAADPPARGHARPHGQALGRDHRDADHARTSAKASPCCEYFTSTHGARKGLADTALKTADSGYLTRRLVDVAQDVIIVRVRLRHRRSASTPTPLVEGGDIIQSLGDRVLGRVAAEDIRDPFTGEIIVQANTRDQRGAGAEDRGLRASSGSRSAPR